MESFANSASRKNWWKYWAYCYWAVRDALDPRLGGMLALPLDDERMQELTHLH